jgi:DNA-binding GntR family transcriptional regulator
MTDAVVRPKGSSLIERDNISDAVAAELRRRIVDGRLPAGDRINEVHLSRELGVSRTPLREGLAQLAAEGALRHLARIGYFVLPLTLEEFEQIDAIRPILEPEALKLAGLPSPARIGRLGSINRQIERERDADRVIDLDDAWHLELIAACPNRALVDLIRQFTCRTRRYELALMRERRNVLAALADHQAIMAALDRLDLDGACAALRTNLLTGRAPIREWLNARELAEREGSRYR